jgi:hypothetical protein
MKELAMATVRQTPRPSGPVFLMGRARALVTHPLFLVLSVLGNGAILAGALFVYGLEHDVNPGMDSFLDALWWSVATVTTVGYGDVLPVTALGKIGGMVLMISGTAIFGSFTALVAAVLLQPEIEEVEDEMRDLERNFRH